MLNILICGTPGTGKSRIVENLKNTLVDFHFINISKFAIEHNLTLGYDETLASHIIDEDSLIEKLMPILNQNQNNVIESIHADIFSNDQIDVVFVCRTDNTLLFDRLKERQYSDEKMNNNIQAEIFQVILDEARENFEVGKIVELYNNNPSDLDENIPKILEAVKNFSKT